MDMDFLLVIYIDDLLSHFNGTFEVNLGIVDRILTCLETTVIEINAKKTNWGAHGLDFLGFLLGTDKYRPLHYC